MPTWSQILGEISAAAELSNIPFHYVRRQYLRELRKHTKRDTILYASGWIQRPEADAGSMIGSQDIQALMGVSHGLRSRQLDLILHSPGGHPEHAEAMVSYLRSRFDHIRVIVPNFAMSAATMVACAADEIVMGKHSFLGPTDPQFVLETGLGKRAVAAQAILDQYDKVQRECTDPRTDAQLSAWKHMLAQYVPDIISTCEYAIGLSKELVGCWLKAWMFKGEAGSAKKAEAVAEWLADHEHFKSHMRPISREEIKNKGLKVIDLESDPVLQDLSLSVFHATTHTFSMAPIAKIVENHDGELFASPTSEASQEHDLKLQPKT